MKTPDRYPSVSVVKWRDRFDLHFNIKGRAFLVLKFGLSICLTVEHLTMSTMLRNNLRVKSLCFNSHFSLVVSVVWDAYTPPQPWPLTSTKMKCAEL